MHVIVLCMLRGKIEARKENIVIFNQYHNSSSRASSQLLDSMDFHSEDSDAAIILPTVVRCAAYKSISGFELWIGQDLCALVPRVKDLGAGGLLARISPSIRTLHTVVFSYVAGSKIALR